MRNWKQLGICPSACKSKCVKRLKNNKQTSMYEIRMPWNSIVDKPVVTVNSSVKVVEGSAHTFYCSSTSKPLAFLKWTHENRTLQTATLASNLFYTIGNITRYNYGLYICTAINEVGRDSGTTTVTVTCKYTLLK